MIISRIETGELRENTYLVLDKKTRRGILVDPGDDAKSILKALKGCVVSYVFLTHTHYDHILGLLPVLEKTQASVVVSEREKDGLSCGAGHWSKKQAVALDIVSQTLPRVSEVVHVSGGEHFHVDGLSIDVIATPGHTSGSISVHVNDALFTGDTLFSHSIGRTDLPTGSHHDIMESIQRLFTLSGDTRVFPGHGEATTIAKRKQDSERGMLY